MTVKQSSVLLPINKIITALVTAFLLMGAKATWDIYAFLTVKDKLIETVEANEAAVSLVSGQIETKADRFEVVAVENKLDKVLSGLCIIEKKTCQLQD